jgi:hypothetical protein
VASLAACRREEDASEPEGVASASLPFITVLAGSLAPARHWLPEFYQS